jgi:hypothetical protein
MTDAGQTAVPVAHTGVKGARRVAIIAIVASLSITALVGIAVLLTGTDDDALDKVLVTALVLAAFSVTSLCHLAVVGRAPQIVGFVGIVGIVASVCAFVAAEVLIWADNLSSDANQNWSRTLGVLTVLALSLAHANLLLLLESRKRLIVRVGLKVTLTLIALVAIGIWIPILDNGTFPDSNSEWYWRVFGVVAILDALGTIVLPVTGAVLRDQPRRIDHQLALPADLVERLELLAAKQNSTSDAVAIDILERGTGGSL